MNEHDDKIVDQMANKVFNVWTRWLRFIFANGKFNKDGSFTISESLTERWTGMMNTNYSQLTDKQKLSNRIIANYYIEVFRKIIEKKSKEPK